MIGKKISGLNFIAVLKTELFDSYLLPKLQSSDRTIVTPSLVARISVPFDTQKLEYNVLFCQMC